MKVLFVIRKNKSKLIIYNRAVNTQPWVFFHNKSQQNLRLFTFHEYFNTLPNLSSHEREAQNQKTQVWKGGILPLLLRPRDQNKIERIFRTVPL